MVDAVVREDRDRLLRVEPALEQRLRDAPHRAVGFAVADFSPGIALASFREEYALGRLVGPLNQPLGDAASVRRELLRRAQQHAAVAALLELDFRRGESHSCLLFSSISHATMLRR